MDGQTPEAAPGFPLAPKIGASGKHVLTLKDDFLEIRREGGTTITVPRWDRGRLVTMKRTLFGGRLLTVRTPRIIALGLTPEAAAAYEEWRGPLTHEDLRRVTRSGFFWALAVGVIFVLAGLPLPADPASGEAARPADPAALALGGAILAIGVLRFVWASRYVFLLDLIWFAGLAAYVVFDVAREGRSLWWLLLLPLFFVAAKDLVHRFRDFAVIAPPEELGEPRPE